MGFAVEGRISSLILLCLMAPSTPICKIQGTAEYSQDINLTCASAEGSPAPTYKWDRRNVQNISVPQDPKTTDMLSGVGAIDVSIPQNLYEFARGDSMTLPCSFKPKNPITPTQLVIISWSVLSADADPQEILNYYSDRGTLDIDPLYDGRASLDADVLQGKANLKLSSLTLADNKTFECRLQIPGDRNGKPAATTRVMVLGLPPPIQRYCVTVGLTVAPSTPICKIQGTAEYGQNITLTCVSEEGSPAPTYKWDRRNVQNISVPQDPKTTDKGSILSLYDISSDTSGFYICTSGNKIRSATCNLTLSVTLPSMTFGIIARVVAFLSFLIIVIFCFFRKKSNEKKYATGVCEKVEYHKEPAPSREPHTD